MVNWKCSLTIYEYISNQWLSFNQVSRQHTKGKYSKIATIFPFSLPKRKLHSWYYNRYMILESTRQDLNQFRQKTEASLSRLDTSVLQQFVHWLHNIWYLRSQLHHGSKILLHQLSHWPTNSIRRFTKARQQKTGPKNLKISWVPLALLSLKINEFCSLGNFDTNKVYCSFSEFTKKNLIHSHS